MSIRQPPKYWIDNFKELLRRGGVEIDDRIIAGRRNFFRVGLSGKEIIVVGASSTRIGFWGITKDIVKKAHEAGEWGAVFIDMKGDKAYWVPGPNVVKLSDSQNDNEYLFHDDILAENRAMAYAFGETV
jgi:hypothetical protein